eukprot:6201019-Pleurochrysis_carterae.AAC.2
MQCRMVAVHGSCKRDKSRTLQIKAVIVANDSLLHMYTPCPPCACPRGLHTICGDKLEPAQRSLA